jgi:hypothetical protein
VKLDAVLTSLDPSKIDDVARGRPHPGDEPVAVLGEHGTVDVADQIDVAHIVMEYGGGNPKAGSLHGRPCMVLADLQAGPGCPGWSAATQDKGKKNKQAPQAPHQSLINITARDRNGRTT